ncbi:MAG TPA: hypothetical protein VF150_08165, partial [Thermoanaerobaculia bacterium]
MTSFEGKGRRPAAAALVVLAGLGALAAAGCGGRQEARRERAAGSAVWVDPRAAALDPAGRRVLAEAGIDEVFLEAASLGWDGAEPAVEEVPGAFDGAAPAGTPVTLAVRQGAPAPEELDPEPAGRRLAEAFRGLRLRAEAAGLLPVGYHLELGAGAPPELVGSLRAAAGPELHVSAGLPRAALRDAAGLAWSREVARASDFVVAVLYGRPPDAPDDPAAWDPERVVADLAALESLERDYLVGLMVVGGLHRLSPAGETREATTRAELKALAREPALRLSIADPFAGVGRVVHTFQAQRAVRAAVWDLAPGESVRVIRTAPSLVQGLLERLRTADAPHRLGQLYYRVAAPEEALSLGPAELAAATGTSPPVPEIVPRLVVESVSSGSVLFEVELHNRSGQSTDLATTDGNFLQVRAEEGFFARVEPGEFFRYSLWRDGREARPGLGWREPDEVRLYTPMVRGGERIGGAVLELRSRGPRPRVAVGGRFFLPDGRELELPATGGPVSQPGVLGGSEGE